MKAVSRKQIELAKHDSRWIRAEEAEQEMLSLQKENQELKESLNVAKYKDHKEDETDKERRDRINRFRSGY